jgi:hypothetical protein
VYSRFLKHRAAFLRLRRQDLIDLSLRHDRIRRAADAGVHQHVVDVLEPAQRAVDPVLGTTVPEHPAGDRNLVVIHLQRLLAVRHRQRDLRHAQRLAFLGAVENDVRHLAAPQCLRRGLAEHPADRIHDVGLAAAVRPDDARHALCKLEYGLVRKGLEAVDFNGLQIHG